MIHKEAFFPQRVFTTRFSAWAEIYKCKQIPGYKNPLIPDTIPSPIFPAVASLSYHIGNSHLSLDKVRETTQALCVAVDIASVYRPDYKFFSDIAQIHRTFREQKYTQSWDGTLFRSMYTYALLLIHSRNTSPINEEFIHAIQFVMSEMGQTITDAKNDVSPANLALLKQLKNHWEDGQDLLNWRVQNERRRRGQDPQKSKQSFFKRHVTNLIFHRR